MAPPGIQEGNFVWYPAKGLGRVQKVEDNSAKVLFWADGRAGKTEALRVNLLTPLPRGDKAKPGDTDFSEWARESPLTMVALALRDLPVPAGEFDIREKLDGRVPLRPNWTIWWNRTKPKLSKLPDHFKIVGSARDAKYILLSSVQDVPADRNTSLDDWKAWLLSDTDEPPPEAFPTSEVAASLAEWPEDSIEQALWRTLRGAEEFLYSARRPAMRPAVGWMDAVSSAALRCSVLRYDSSIPVLQIGEDLSGLSAHLKGTYWRLFQAGAFAEAPDRQRLLSQAYQTQERQKAEYEESLKRYCQEQERQRADYESLLEKQRQEQQNQRAAHATEVEKIRQSHVEELERERREQERLRRQIQTLDAHMASGREESRLEIRYGILLAVGDALQRAHLQGNSAEDRLNNVITTLPNALREGEAATFGAVGDTVKYDPKLHHSSEAIPGGTKVRLAAPGVAVGERVILKASVSTETEV